MATSEHILTVGPKPTTLPDVSPHELWRSPDRPIWRQIIQDIGTMFLVLALLPLFLNSNTAGRLSFRDDMSPLASACTIAAILVLTGAYRRSLTPLAIGETEGLVRGVACAATFVMVRNATHGLTAIYSAFLFALLLTLPLVLQREFIHIRGRRLSLVRRLPFSTASRIAEGNLFPLPYDALQVESHLAQLVKRLVDFIGAAVVLLLLFPFLLMVAIFVKMDSDGPIFLRQRRIGRNGVPFHMWKFRSMHHGVPRYARSPANDSDPRLTRVGRILRRFSIDELPQLINVIRGEMSLVGPRPEMPFIVRRYEPRERLRLNALPGITGLWQISAARAQPIHHNVELDLFYISHRTLCLDIAILLRTVTAVVRGIGAA